MTEFEKNNLECKLALSKLNHIFESYYSSASIKLDVLNNDFMCERVDDNTYNIVYESKIKDISSKVVKVIDSMIRAIGDFIKKQVDKFMELFNKKDNKEKIDMIERNINKIPDDGEKVEVYTTENKIELLDSYIREVVKLERKIFNLKTSNRAGKQNSAMITIAYMEIQKELDTLNEKFDKQFLDDNADIIIKAKKDALRFSTKQLKNVKLDMDAIKEQSDNVLMRFKKDANGCEIPIHLNMLQKLSGSIASRARKTIGKCSNYHHTGLKITLLASASIFAFTHKDLIKKQAVDFMNKTHIPSDAVRQQVKDFMSGANIPTE